MDNVLYRLHRPKNFKEVRAQNEIVSVLENSIKNNKISHSYIFSGERGTGKTSIARIFAKELGCSDVDIFEIDAASHTSVEDIREINQEIYSMPVESKYKVYIFDEVHMLSKSAFNAFLKTLEEPPKHIIFILATTELDKVPETITSRCVMFKFNTPSVEEIKEVVKQTASKEKYKLSTQSASLIAFLSEGSFRDALSLLQKVLSISKPGEIKTEKVEEILGAPTSEMINNYVKYLIAKDVKNGVNLLNEIEKSGYSFEVFAKLLLKKIRAMVLLKNGYDGLAKEYEKDDLEFISDMSKNENINIDLLTSVSESIMQIKDSYIKQLPLEYLLLDS